MFVIYESGIPMTKKVEETVELLDLRGLDYREKVEVLHSHYKKANDIWAKYPQCDPRLKETFKTLDSILEDYKRLLNNT